MTTHYVMWTRSGSIRDAGAIEVLHEAWVEKTGNDELTVDDVVAFYSNPLTDYAFGYDTDVMDARDALEVLTVERNNVREDRLIAAKQRKAILRAEVRDRLERGHGGEFIEKTADDLECSMREVKEAVEEAYPSLPDRFKKLHRYPPANMSNAHLKATWEKDWEWM